MNSEPEIITASSAQMKRNYCVGISIILFIVIVGISYWLYSQTKFPSKHDLPATLQVDRGMSVKEISSLAETQGIVKSELFLYVILTSLYDPTNIHAGRYVIDRPLNVFEIAEKLASNDVDELLVTITIPEGITGKQIADIADQALQDFDRDLFIKSVETNEGYLFPDTYFVPETYTEKEFFELLFDTFAKKFKPLEDEANGISELKPEEIVILASIIEREANDEGSMKMVSGILQNRLALGIPLQADATIEYTLDRPLNELKPGELADYLQTIDSPYNTYKYAGLPPTPIGNPGLMALKAVFYPTQSDYLFYITDVEGNFHYAETLAEHNQNIARYLR